MLYQIEKYSLHYGIRSPSLAVLLLRFAKAKQRRKSIEKMSFIMSNQNIANAIKSLSCQNINIYIPRPVHVITVKSIELHSYML